MILSQKEHITFNAVMFALWSQAEIDYTILRNALKEQDFRRASGETRALIIRLAGEVAIKRGWVFYAEVVVLTSLCTYVTPTTMYSY